MAIEIVNSFEGLFIGTVTEINVTTREVAVYLPKLMPAIPFGGQVVTTKTNLSNSKLNISYNSNISTTSQFWVKSENSDEPMPNIGSKVVVYFLENNPRFGFWKKFKPDANAYSVIDSEKYPKLARLSINNIITDIMSDDEVVIELGEGFECTKVVEGKKTTIRIIPKETAEANTEFLSEIANLKKKLTVPKAKTATVTAQYDGETISDILINITSDEVDKFEVRIGESSVTVQPNNTNVSILEAFRKFFLDPADLSAAIKDYGKFNIRVYSRSSKSYLYDSDEYITVEFEV